MLGGEPGRGWEEGGVQGRGRGQRKGGAEKAAPGRGLDWRGRGVQLGRKPGKGAGTEELGRGNQLGKRD